LCSEKGTRNVSRTVFVESFLVLDTIFYRKSLELTKKIQQKLITPNELIIFFIVTSHFIWGVIIPNFILIGICFLILIYILSLREYKIFVNKFTLFLGKISYSAYLVHFAVLLWVDRNTALNYFIKEYSYDYYILNFTLRLSLVIFITTIIAYVFFKIIEIPFQKLGKKIIEHMNKT
jgi:peptidoglycan/LPS O-acetylase OafA/YrhL